MGSDIMRQKRRDANMKYSAKILSCFVAVGLLTACSSNTDKSADHRNNDEDNQKTGQVEKSDNDKKTNETGSTNTLGGTEPEADTEKANKVEGQGNKSSDDSSSSTSKTGKEVDKTNSTVVESIRKQIKTNLPVMLPTDLPVEGGKYLTAKVQSNNNNYSVVYYQTDKEVPINDESVKKLSKDDVIAKFTGHQYASTDEASDQIGFEEYSKAGGEKVDLGHNITGYQDAGAGSLWIGWNEGRWSLAARTTTDKPKDGLELAKQAVNYLEDNTLPAPKDHGMIHLSAKKSSGNFVKWQNNGVVYSLERIEDSMDMLKTATSVKKD